MSTTCQWYQSDSEDRYISNISGISNYKTDEIKYQFNSDGYRCDEFNLSSEFSVLFMGCSLTEGVGLPLNETWSFYLHQQILKTSIKNIPFWSLAKGGTGIDYAARCYYQYANILKPKYIFYLMSGISRREYSYGIDYLNNWFPYRTPDLKPNKSFLEVEKIFVDPLFAYHQAYRSAMILDSTAKLHNTKIFIFGLSMDYDINGEKRKELFSNFSNINYFETDELLNHYGMCPIPANLKHRPLSARDNSHPGAWWQYNLHRMFWDVVKDEIIFP